MKLSLMALSSVPFFQSVVYAEDTWELYAFEGPCKTDINLENNPGNLIGIGDKSETDNCKVWVSQLNQSRTKSIYLKNFQKLGKRLEVYKKLDVSPGSCSSKAHVTGAPWYDDGCIAISADDYITYFSVQNTS